LAGFQVSTHGRFWVSPEAILGRIPVLNYVLPLFFSWWSRQAEYTADRGGLVACKDLAASQRALARLLIGPDLFDRLNMEELIKQAHTGDISTKASELFSSHPLLAKRLVALAEFAGRHDRDSLT